MERSLIEIFEDIKADRPLSPKEVQKKLEMVIDFSPITDIAKIEDCLDINTDNSEQIIKLLENSKQNGKLEFFLDLFFEKFCDVTTPIYITSNYFHGAYPICVKPHEETVFYAWNFLIANHPNIFNKQDLEMFTQKYTETLFARTTHKILPFEPYYTKSNTIKGAKFLVKPPYEYIPLDGIYHFDAKILCKMSIDSKLLGLKTDSIYKAITQLSFQKDPGQARHDFTKAEKLYYMPIAAQKELFLQYRELTKQIIASPTPETVSMLRKKEHAKLTRRKHKLQRFAQKYCPFSTLAEGIEKAYQRRKKEKEYMERYKQKSLEKEQEKNL